MQYLSHFWSRTENYTQKQQQLQMKGYNGIYDHIENNVSKINNVDEAKFKY